MPGIGTINLKVAVLDSDFYAMQTINSYLAWDRRTRVTFMTHDPAALWDYLQEAPPAELPDIIITDADHHGDAQSLYNIITQLRQALPELMIVCLAHHANLALVESAAEAGANAFMLKQEVRFQLAWAIIYTLEHDFVITTSIMHISKASSNKRIFNAQRLPEQRDYPEMTDRIRQAIRLCVIEGMPAHLAADEMGISLHTIRGYIKEGYRILETYDHYEYPVDMTPQERAFMRFTALADME